MGTFSALNIGEQALKMSQLALEVTGHNIANVNTDGYTRQRVEFTSGAPTDTGFGQVGTGVMLDEIMRTTDIFIQNQLAEEAQVLAARQRENDVFKQVEAIFNEPAENNFSSVLNNFFDSLSSLSSEPESSSVRAMVVESGHLLTESIQSLNQRLEDVRTRIDESIALKVNDVNTKIQQIAELNEKISRAETSGMFQANDYRDKREELVMELEELMDVTVVPDGTDSNTISITVAGAALVHRNQYYPITADLNEDNHYDINSSQTSAAIPISNGELKGYMEGREVILPEYQDMLDTLAKDIAYQVNMVHMKGVGLDGFQDLTSHNAAYSPSTKLNRAGLPFDPTDGSFHISVYDNDKNLVESQEIFVSGAANSLEDIRAQIDAMANVTATLTVNNELNIQVDNIVGGSNFTFVGPNGESDTSGFLVAMGMNTFFTGTTAEDIQVNDVINNDLNKIAAASTYSPGDNGNLLEMINLRSKLTMTNGTTTFDQYYGSIVSKAGLQAEESNHQYETSQSIVSILEQRLLESTGVSLDEEVVNMIKFQRSYQAAAKFVSGVNEMILTLFNSF